MFFIFTQFNFDKYKYIFLSLTETSYGIFVCFAKINYFIKQ